jgi:hypothetical protein
MNGNRFDQADEKQIPAPAVIDVLLAHVPAMPEQPPQSTQWIESSRKKSDPQGIF